MKTVTLRSHVGEDGVLRLEVPIGIANADLEVVLVVQPTSLPKRNHTESKQLFEALRQTHQGKTFSDSVELMREDRQR